LASADLRVDVMFRERAFWLFGTGTRLGDLRRLVRQYGRGSESVFPTGTYLLGTTPGIPYTVPSYGTEVSLTTPTSNSSSSALTNPNFKGCLDHNA
jgi:starch-binding outer membrane protein, SusD/RagB family